MNKNTLYLYKTFQNKVTKCFTEQVKYNSVHSQGKNTNNTNKNVETNKLIYTHLHYY